MPDLVELWCLDPRDLTFAEWHEAYTAEQEQARHDEALRRGRERMRREMVMLPDNPLPAHIAHAMQNMDYQQRLAWQAAQMQHSNKGALVGALSGILGGTVWR